MYFAMGCGYVEYTPVICFSFKSGDIFLFMKID